MAAVFTTAQTVITSGPVEGTWTLSESPYEIQGGIYVANGTTLTIEPGVVVRFNTTERFEIYGCLLAEGTEQNSITFTNYEQFVRWGGINMDKHTFKQRQFKNCVLLIRICICLWH